MYPLLQIRANCIYGNTGSGKTLFAMAMAIHIASKRNFLDWQVQNAAPVLYVEGELPADDIILDVTQSSKTSLIKIFLAS